MGDLRERVPGHALIDQLLREWDKGTIHLDPGGTVVVDDEAKSWYRGVIGERHVASLLSQLDSSWTVLHSVPVGRGGSDIDHVVVGPRGVFVINTKYHPGKTIWAAGYGLLVDGHKTRYVRSAIDHGRMAAVRLGRAIGRPVSVTSVIAIVNPGRIDRHAPSGEADVVVKIVTDSELMFLFDGPPDLPEEDTRAIAQAAADPQTWLAGVPESSIAAHIAQEFAALEAAVGPALAAAAPRPQAPRRARTRSRAPQSERASSYPAPWRSTPSRSRQRRQRPGPGAQLVEGLLRLGVSLTALGIGYYVLTHLSDFMPH